MSVGNRIRALRSRNKISSQEELAYLVGTARQTISSWERDICLPEGANLLKLAKVLNTSVAYIMGETPQPEPRKRQGRLLAERRVARTDSYIDGKKLERQNGALRAPA